MRALLILLVLLVLSVPALADDTPSPPGPHLITVMSRNVYHGADAEINAVPGAATFPELLARVAAVYQAYHARNFPERAQALAAEIAATRPALIGLQEVLLVRTGAFLDPAPAQTVDLDFLQILLDTLAAQGLQYEVVAQIHGFDVELPSGLGFDLRHTDRDVVLARSDLPPGHLRLSNVQTGDYTVNCQIPTNLAGPLTVLRGWISVDVWTRGRDFRFVNTHLFGQCPPGSFAVQVAQAQELLAGPANTALPVVLVGDMNSSPMDAAPSGYLTLTTAGFADAWLHAGVGNGFTCCQAPDLLNAAPLLDSRIDFVFARGAAVTEVEITGDNPAQRTPSGLWGSDHAGVAATLMITTP